MAHDEYRKLYEIAEEVEYLRKQINLICKRMGIEHQIKTKKNYYGWDVQMFDGIFGENGLKLEDEDNVKKDTNVINYFDKKK